VPGLNEELQIQCEPTRGLGVGGGGVRCIDSKSAKYPLARGDGRAGPRGDVYTGNRCRPAYQTRAKAIGRTVPHGGCKRGTVVVPINRRQDNTLRSRGEARPTQPRNSHVGKQGGISWNPDGGVNSFEWPRGQGNPCGLRRGPKSKASNRISGMLWGQGERKRWMRWVRPKRFAKKKRREKSLHQRTSSDARPGSRRRGPPGEKPQKRGGAGLARA